MVPPQLARTNSRNQGQSSNRPAGIKKSNPKARVHETTSPHSSSFAISEIESGNGETPVDLFGQTDMDLAMMQARTAQAGEDSGRILEERTGCLQQRQGEEALMGYTELPQDHFPMSSAPYGCLPRDHEMVVSYCQWMWQLEVPMLQNLHKLLQDQLALVTQTRADWAEHRKNWKSIQCELAEIRLKISDLKHNTKRFKRKGLIFPKQTNKDWVRLVIVEEEAKTQCLDSLKANKREMEEIINEIHKMKKFEREDARLRPLEAVWVNEPMLPMEERFNVIDLQVRSPRNNQFLYVDVEPINDLLWARMSEFHWWFDTAVEDTATRLQVANNAIHQRKILLDECEVELNKRRACVPAEELITERDIEVELKINNYKHYAQRGWQEKVYQLILERAKERDKEVLEARDCEYRVREGELCHSIQQELITFFRNERDRLQTILLFLRSVARTIGDNPPTPTRMTFLSQLYKICCLLWQFTVLHRIVSELINRSLEDSYLRLIRDLLHGFHSELKEFKYEFAEFGDDILDNDTVPWKWYALFDQIKSEGSAVALLISNLQQLGKNADEDRNHGGSKPHSYKEPPIIPVQLTWLEVNSLGMEAVLYGTGLESLGSVTRRSHNGMSRKESYKLLRINIDMIGGLEGNSNFIGSTFRSPDIWTIFYSGTPYKHLTKKEITGPLNDRLEEPFSEEVLEAFLVYCHGVYELFCFGVRKPNIHFSKACYDVADMLTAPQWFTSNVYVIERGWELCEERSIAGAKRRLEYDRLQKPPFAARIEHILRVNANDYMRKDPEGNVLDSKNLILGMINTQLENQQDISAEEFNLLIPYWTYSGTFYVDAKFLETERVSNVITRVDNGWNVDLSKLPINKIKEKPPFFDDLMRLVQRINFNDTQSRTVHQLVELLVTAIRLYEKDFQLYWGLSLYKIHLFLRWCLSSDDRLERLLRLERSGAIWTVPENWPNIAFFKKLTRVLEKKE